jgi:glycosyltransferase involved in cell wall biosynthesis
VIRSRIPNALRPVLQKESNIRLIESRLTNEEIEDLFWECDLAVAPSLPTPWTSFLDAMNHELPVLTVDTHVNSELVTSDTGFVCDVPSELNCVKHTYLVPDREMKNEIDQAWLHGMENTVAQMADKAELLVEDRQRRLSMSKSGRANLSDHGRFSLSRRNEALNRVLDKHVGDL